MHMKPAELDPMQLLSESQVDGDFDGWFSDHIYLLDDGTAWRLVRPLSSVSCDLFRPRTCVYVDCDSYFLEVEGAGRRREVQRVSSAIDLALRRGLRRGKAWIRNAFHLLTREADSRRVCRLLG